MKPKGIKFTRKTQTKQQKEPLYFKSIKAALLNRTIPQKANRRPTKLTPELQEVIVEKIELGLPQIYASQCAGITEITFGFWMKWGKAEEDRIKKEMEKVIETLQKKNQLDPDNEQQMEAFIDAFMQFQPHNKYLDFLYAIKDAKAKCHQIALFSIRNAQVGGKYLDEEYKEMDAKGKVIKEVEKTKYLKPDWNAGAWYLERRHGDIYRQKSTDQDNKQSVEDLARELHAAMSEMDSTVSGEGED